MSNRTDFEAWWNAQHTMYAQNPAEWSWLVWQAATAAERERAAKVCEEHPEGSSYQLRPRLAAAIRKG